ncbi:MAG: fluoride efflux transporter FluC [Planctomycetota bacterium]|jgi:CrcB protein
MPAVLLSCGGVLRWALVHVVDGTLIPRWGAWPWATLVANVLGSLLIGLVAGVWSQHEWVRLLVMAGLLGGFTTFSSFSLQTIELIGRGAWLPALAYVATSLLACLIAAALGLALGRALAG